MCGHYVFFSQKSLDRQEVGFVLRGNAFSTFFDVRQHFYSFIVLERSHGGTGSILKFCLF